MDIFSKKFIFVPVNENYHWYLAVIYNPAGILQKARAAKTTPPAAVADVDELESISSSSRGSSRGVKTTPAADDDDLESIESTGSGSAKGAVAPGEAGLPTGVDEEVDELNIIDQPDELQAPEDPEVTDVRARVGGLDLEPAPPQPISSQTWDVFQAQGESAGPATRTSPPAEVQPTSPPPAKKHGRKPHREDYDILGSDE